MYRENIFNEKKSLLEVARTAIIISMHKAIDNCKKFGPNKKPEEPDYVAALVLEGTKILEEGWSALLRRYNIPISITGIYCHQTPKVHYKGMQNNSCEIGDLLWCHFHKKTDGTYYNSALLLQAKKISKLPYNISKNEMDQFNLYHKWPEFKYVKSGTLNDQKRKVNPSAPRIGAQYLAIEENSLGLYGISRRYPCKTCLSYNPLVFHRDLGSELTGFLNFASGDMFDDKITSSSLKDWSTVIWDLLEITANTIMNRKRSGLKNPPRISGFQPDQLHGCINMSKLVNNKFFDSFFSKKDYNSFLKYCENKEPPKPDKQFYNDENTGLSTIIIETHESEQ